MAFGVAGYFFEIEFRFGKLWRIHYLSEGCIFHAVKRSFRRILRQFMKKNENGDDPPCRAFPGQVKTHASMTGPTRRLRQTAQKDLKRPVMEAARKVPLAIGGELRNLD